MLIADNMLIESGRHTDPRGPSRVSYITAMMTPERPFTPLERKLYLTHRCGYLCDHLWVQTLRLDRKHVDMWGSLQWMLDYESSVMRQGFHAAPVNL